MTLSVFFLVCEAGRAVDSQAGEAIFAFRCIDHILKNERWTILAYLEQSQNTTQTEDDLDAKSALQLHDQAQQALRTSDPSLQSAAAHRVLLEALCLQSIDFGEWSKQIIDGSLFLKQALSKEEQFRTLYEIGSLAYEEEENLQNAIKAFEEARALKPFHSGVLEYLSKLYQRTQSWNKLMGTLEALVQIEQEPLQKSRYFYTLAELYRDQKRSRINAVRLFEQALAHDPNRLETLEQIQKIFTEQNDWRGLEQVLQSMTGRFSRVHPEPQGLLFHLWHQLGMVYQDRLNKKRSAIQAFYKATCYTPDQAVERKVIAGLYEVTDQFEKAILEHNDLLKKDPFKIDSYQSLYRIYQNTRQTDAAWCTSRTLAFLQCKGVQQKDFLQVHRLAGGWKHRLDDEQWAHNLFVQETNQCVNEIFKIITPAALAYQTHRVKNSHLHAVFEQKLKQNMSKGARLLASAFKSAAQALGVPCPELYVQQSVPGGLAFVVALSPATVVEETLLTGCSPQEYLFLAGKHLSFYRAEHSILHWFPTLSELQLIFSSAFKIGMTDFSVPPDRAQAVEKAANRLAKSMQPIQKKALGLQIQRFISQGEKADLKQWLHTTELTACRAGFLLCGDLHVARKMIEAQPKCPDDWSPQEKMKQLLLFSVSAHYFSLREALGIALS